MESSSQNQTVATSIRRLANWSLFLGLFGFLFSFVFVGIPFALAAIVCGHVARARLKRAGGTAPGRGKALVGLLGGYAAVLVLGLMLSIESLDDKLKDAAKGNACIANLRQIDTAKEFWAQANKKTDGDPPTFADLKPFLPTEPKCPKGGQYTLNALGAAPQCSIPGHKLSFRDPPPSAPTNEGTKAPAQRSP